MRVEGNPPTHFAGYRISSLKITTLVLSIISGSALLIAAIYGSGAFSAICGAAFGISLILLVASLSLPVCFPPPQESKDRAQAIEKDLKETQAETRKVKAGAAAEQSKLERDTVRLEREKQKTEDAIEQLSEEKGWPTERVRRYLEIFDGSPINESDLKYPDESYQKALKSAAILGKHSQKKKR